MVTVNPGHLYHGAGARLPFPIPAAIYVSRFQPGSGKKQSRKRLVATCLTLHKCGLEEIIITTSLELTDITRPPW